MIKLCIAKAIQASVWVGSWTSSSKKSFQASRSILSFSIFRKSRGRRQLSWKFVWYQWLNKLKCSSIAFMRRTMWWDSLKAKWKTVIGILILEWQLTLSREVKLPSSIFSRLAISQICCAGSVGFWSQILVVFVCVHSCRVLHGEQWPFCLFLEATTTSVEEWVESTSASIHFRLFLQFISPLIFLIFGGTFQCFSNFAPDLKAPEFELRMTSHRTSFVFL